MDHRGNSGSRDSLLGSTFAGVKRRDSLLFRLFGSTHEYNANIDQFGRLSLSNSKVPENVEEAPEPAGEQAVVENHIGAEAGSSNREVTTWENGTPFLIDLNISAETQDAAAGVEVGVPEPQVTTLANRTPFIDLTISDEDEDRSPADLSISEGDEAIHEPATGPWEEEAHTNVGCETHEAFEGEIVVHESYEAINFSLPDLNEIFSEDAAGMSSDNPSGNDTSSRDAETTSEDTTAYKAERNREGKALASEGPSAMDIDTPNGDETIDEDAAAREAAERKRKGKAIAYGRVSGAKFDRRQSEEAPSEFERQLKEASLELLKTYETELRVWSESGAPESEAAKGQHVGYSNDFDSIPLVDVVDEGAMDVAPDVVTDQTVSFDNDSASIHLMDGVDEGTSDVAPDVVTGDELVLYEGRDTRSESEAPTGKESPKQKAKNVKPSKTLDGKKKRKAQKRKTPDVVTDNGPTEALPPRRNPRRRTHQDPDENLLLLANTSLGQNAINVPAVASTSRSEPKGPKTKSLHVIIASEKAKGQLPSGPIEEPEEDAEDAYDAVPVGPAEDTLDAVPLVPVEEPNNAVPLIPVEEPNNAMGPDEESDDVTLASLIKRKAGRANKNKKQKVDKRKVPRFSEGGQTSHYVPKGYLKVYPKKGAETVPSNEDRIGGPSISGFGSGVDQTDANDANMNEAETDPLGDDGVDVANHEDAGQRDQEGGFEPPEIGWPTTSGLGSEMGRTVEGTSRGAETDPLGDDGVDMADCVDSGSCDQEGRSEPPELGGPVTSGLGSEGGLAGEGTGRGAQTVVARPWYRDIMVVLNQNPADFGAEIHDMFKR